MGEVNPKAKVMRQYDDQVSELSISQSDSKYKILTTLVSNQLKQTQSRVSNKQGNRFAKI